MLVFINLIPIFWMIWSSLMGNNDILQGKMVSDSLRNDVVYSEFVNNQIISGTINGQLAMIPSDFNPENIVNQDLGTLSSSYLRQGNALWVVSSNKGLMQIDLQNGNKQSSYPWSHIQKAYQNSDQTSFVIKPGTLTKSSLEDLVLSLNNEPVVDVAGMPSLASLCEVHFRSDSKVIDDLNTILNQAASRHKILSLFRKHGEWGSPLIQFLLKKSDLQESEEKMLIRYFIAERYPHTWTRFEMVPWVNIWVNRIPGTANGSSIALSQNKILFSFWWEDFPGVGIFNIEDQQIKWITMRHGLPSASIQHLIEQKPGQVLAVTDMGFSLLDINTPRVIANYEFGEYGLPYLDGRRIEVVKMNTSSILIAYGQELVLFDLELKKSLKLNSEFLQNITSEITELLVIDDKIYLGTSQGLFVLPAQEWVAAAEEKQPIRNFEHYNRTFFRDLETRLTEDNVIQDIDIAMPYALLGGLNGNLAMLNLESRVVQEGHIFPKGAFYIHWRNYIDMWKTIPFGKFLFNSFVICLSVMLISMVIASLAGYALARFNFPGRNLFGGGILATQMIPGLLYLIPIFILYTTLQNSLHIELINTYHGIILTYSAFFTPMSIWILRGFFANIPRELEEAALIDGCTPWGAFIRIIVPAALPGIIATGIFIFLLAWDELMFAWVLSTDLNTATIPVGIRLYVGQFGNRFDLMMAAATVATLPVMLLFFIMQRHIISGLTSGAVKG
jgi:ABC-type glycerol-3-phosphate transport system permease component